MGKVKKKGTREHVHYHRDGSVWARGEMTTDDLMSGYWEWFRKDGTKMRSGYFAAGEQAGEWTTYDRNGEVVKVTQMKAKGVKQATPNKAAKQSANRKTVAKKKVSKKRA